MCDLLRYSYGPLQNTNSLPIISLHTHTEETLGSDFFIWVVKLVILVGQMLFVVFSEQSVPTPQQSKCH